MGYKPFNILVPKSGIDLLRNVVKIYHVVQELKILYLEINPKVLLVIENNPIATISYLSSKYISKLIKYTMKKINCQYDIIICLHITCPFKTKF